MVSFPLPTVPMVKARSCVPACRRVLCTACGRHRAGASSSPTWAAVRTVRRCAQTAGSSLTAQQPDNNIVRVTIQALAAILGGHEHDQHFDKVGKTVITKALANAKSAYIISLDINKKRKKVKVRTQLEKIDETIAIDSVTNSVVQKWQNIAEKNYSSLGFNAKKVLLTQGEPLDGKESEVRSHPTNLTRLIITSIANAIPKADAVIMNSGSIRVDDVLPMPIT